MRTEPGIRLKIIAGYSDCWYCNATVVDAREYQINEPASDGGRPMRIRVCRKRLCRESADDGAFNRNES